MIGIRSKNKRAGRNPRETLVRVPNDLLRERFNHLVETGAMSAAKIALAAGYVNDRPGRAPAADVSRLKRQLGIVESLGGARRDGKRERCVVRSVGYDAAVALCRAMGVEYPAEMGV